MALTRSEATAAVRNAQFVALYQEVHPQAWRLVLYLCGRREDAEDLLAEAVARAMRSFDRLNDHAKFKPWFMKLIRNLHIDHCRARKRQLDVADFGADGLVWERLDRYPLLPGPQGQLEARSVFRALDTLPEPLRLPLSLSALEGLSLQEIGEIMGLSAGAVKVRIHRARKKLIEMLGPEYGVDQ
jgi:RNA polymerase sigma-70 factor (ECF subfamily)